MNDNKFKHVIAFHLMHYTDPKKDNNPGHVIISAMILEGKILHYDMYARICITKDIAGVSQRTWDEDSK